MFGKRAPKTSGPQSERARARSLFQRRATLGAIDSPEAHDVAALEIPPAPLPPLLDHATLGQALRAVREAKGLTLESVADVTRVRRVYLEAIEEMRLDALPSRPFAIGYIRAYADALGLDPALAVERFKSDDPVLDEPLHAPVGMFDERDPRVAAFVIGALVIISAIVVWNVAQRAMMANAPPPALASEAVSTEALASLKGGTVTLGAPLPAPVESTTPPPYETPGMAEALGLTPDPAAKDRPRPATEVAAINLAALPQAFTPQGKVYDMGNPRLTSVVTLQALKPASLILRGADGSVYVGRQLSAGEAFRVPQIAGMTLDVSKAEDFQVFVQGRSRGLLPAQQVLASKLAVAVP